MSNNNTPCNYSLCKLVYLKNRFYCVFLYLAHSFNHFRLLCFILFSLFQSFSFLLTSFLLSPSTLSISFNWILFLLWWAVNKDLVFQSTTVQWLHAALPLPFVYNMVNIVIVLVSAVAELKCQSTKCREKSGSVGCDQPWHGWTSSKAITLMGPQSLWFGANFSREAKKIQSHFWFSFQSKVLLKKEHCCNCFCAHLCI